MGTMGSAVFLDTERFAQQVEKIVNGELQADKKKQ